MYLVNGLVHLLPQVLRSFGQRVFDPVLVKIPVIQKIIAKRPGGEVAISEIEPICGLWGISLLCVSFSFSKNSCNVTKRVRAV